MPSESKALLTAQTEKPNHYSYLKEFRVEQCTLFLQHKCTQHRPFTCFHWHFMNQRRRRPVRKRDGTFNYSADNYCTKYDETTGLCPEGDECPFLHRTAGDTERRYHLRYYKTCMCVHDTDSRGYCVKNGPHCAFAHGNHDLRPPVYDIKEIQALENPDGDASSNSNGPNVLDKERNLMNEDPKWQDTNCVLANYKTEPCKRPPRLCRQGYACPQYHNSRDKRRSPRKYKYRSTPCPNVKHGDEWGEPSNCESGDLCAYCHTRTEQQFHPEIYKSTKCNDVQQAGYCPRGVFCAFAHVDLPGAVNLTHRDVKICKDFSERGFVGVDLMGSDTVQITENIEEMNVARDVAAPLDSGTSLADILSNALPPDPPSSTIEKLSKQHEMKTSEPVSIRNQIMAVENDPLLGPVEKAKQKQSLYLMYSVNSRNSSMSVSAPIVSSVSPLATPFYPASDTVESVIGNALEDLSLDEPLNVAASVDRDLEADSPTVTHSISGLVSSGILGSSAPVNIPGSSLGDRKSLGNFSPSTSSPLQALHSGFLSATGFSHHDSLDSTPTYLNHSHMQLSSSASKIGSFPSGGLYDFSSQQNMSPSNRVHHPSTASPLVNSFPSLSPSLGTNSLSEIHRLREELNSSRAKLATWDDRIGQARTACEAWKREAEESSRKASIAEQQRDEALSQVESLQKEVDQLQGGPHLHCLHRTTDLSKLSLATLKSLQEQLRSDLDDIEKVVYQQTAAKCMVCEENNRTVALLPCNHLVLCDVCSKTHRECPYCRTQISQKSALKMS